ncbi:MAG: hypothetical protein R3F39_11020 [Myxococcota bacterium]
MPPWHMKNLGDASLADAALDAIRARFAAQPAPPPTAAAFFRHQSDGQLHCDVLVYFSPAAAPLALALGATRCPQPPRAGLGLLAGPASAWPSCFPSDPPDPPRLSLATPRPAPAPANTR